MGIIHFGYCAVDKGKCYPNGCICRLNKKAGFQFDGYDYANPQVKRPLRNKKCSNFFKDVKDYQEAKRKGDYSEVT